MPLRDHFRPPLDDLTSWEGFHGGWPMMIVQALQQRLPKRYVAAPRVHLGSMIEIDIATYDQEEPGTAVHDANDGGLATAAWPFAPPTLTAESDLPEQDDYEVLVHDMKRGRRLVAAIEIVSPANKDRPEHRRVFVAKCAALLQQGVSVAIVDLVTTRNFNLYADLLALIGVTDPKLGAEPASTYASACRWTKPGNSPILEAWSYTLEIGQPLPTLPIWLADNFRVPLELEPCYEETCRILRIP
jgi:hypothetical protein